MAAKIADSNYHPDPKRGEIQLPVTSSRLPGNTHYRLQISGKTGFHSLNCGSQFSGGRFLQKVTKRLKVKIEVEKAVWFSATENRGTG
jgi:hypothetical protein